MKVPRLKGLAASAVALATLALPLQAMADHGGGDHGPAQARCAQMQHVEGQFKWLSRQYPMLEQWLMQCAGMAGPVAPPPGPPSPLTDTLVRSASLTVISSNSETAWNTVTRP